MYYIYMLRCEDDTIYTGITTDLDRRIEEHITKSDKCAKYTLLHTAKYLEASWKTEDRKLASKLEYRIKGLSKMQKETLISDNIMFEKLFSMLECERYIRL